MSHGTHIIGIDPGIIHTGVVSALFLPHLREVQVEHHVFMGLDAHGIGILCRSFGQKPQVYVEGFRSRSNLAHDKDMHVGVSEIAKATRGKTLDNTGIKKVVKRPVLEALGIWKFSTPTNHDDLRSAARILVLGMLKEHNALLADVIRDHLDGRPWRVV